MWKFIELYNESRAVSLTFTLILALSIGLLLEVYPFLYWWFLGVSITGLIGTISLVFYKRRQWAKETP